MKIEIINKQGVIQEINTGEDAVWITANNGTPYNLFDTITGSIKLKSHGKAKEAE